MNKILSVFSGRSESTESYIEIRTKAALDRYIKQSAVKGIEKTYDSFHNYAKNITTVHLFGKDWVRVEYWDGDVRLINMDTVNDLKVTGFGE